MTDRAAQSTQRDRLPGTLYTASGVRELDRVAIGEFGVAGITLMRRAGSRAFDLLCASWPSIDRLTVFCGAGNNGGDGYIVAGLAAQRGWQVQVLQLAPAAKLAGDALRAHDWARQFDLSVLPYEPGASITGEVIVDALLGTGLAGAVRADYAAAIDAINESGRPVLAVDIPSGLAADTGTVLGRCVKAHLTVTFIGMKRGLVTGDGPEMCGRLEFASLDVPDAVYERVPGDSQLLHIDALPALLGERNRNAHKGHFGHVLVIGGDHGMGGAVALAAEASARVGAGLVSVATRPAHVAGILARRPEIMVHGVESRQALEPLMERFTCIVIGPGLGRSPWSEQMLQLALERDMRVRDVPLVIDADGLNLLAEASPKPAENRVLTPHPGEAARLLGTRPAVVQEDRFAAAKELQERFGGTVLLKGAGTIVRDADGTGVCPYGNPGMSVGGMGDVLSGVIGGLLAQGLRPRDAAALGACVHSLAADRVAAEAGERGMLASDLFPWLRALVNGGPGPRG